MPATASPRWLPMWSRSRPDRRSPRRRGTGRTAALAVALALAAALIGAACSGTTEPAPPPGSGAGTGATAATPARRVRIAATTDVLAGIADLALGGAMQPSPPAEAELLVAVGAGFDDPAVLDAARRRGTRVLELADRLAPTPRSATDPRPDPHWWLDPDRAGRAGRLIAEAAGVPARSDLERDLAALDEHVQSVLNPLPEGRRTVVTDLESLGYFAARYGLTVRPVPAPPEGGGPDLDRWATTVAAALRDAGTAGPVLGAQPSDPAAMSDALARAVGHPVPVATVAADRLGPAGDPTATYVGMVTALADQLAEILGTV